MRDYLIRNNDREDLEYTLVKVEELYEIKFYENEFRHVTTLGELIDCVIFKIDDDHSINCTTQRAFYKLRKAIAEVLKIDRKEITPKTLWKDILPEKETMDSIEKIEEVLGYQLSLYHPSPNIFVCLVLLLILSVYSLSVHFAVGAISVISSIIFIVGFWVTTIVKRKAILKKITTIETVGEVAEKIAKKHYLQPSRKYEPIDKVEVERCLTILFCEELGLDMDKLITT